MKLIVAIVQPFKVPELVDGVKQQDFPGMTVLECQGFGREKSLPHARSHPLGEDVSDFVRRTLVLIAAPDAQASAIAEWVTKVAHTGRGGDGKLFIVPLETAVRIATGDRDDAALR